MISNRLKEKPMLNTTHRMNVARLTAKIEGIPAEERTPEQRRALAQAQEDVKGIITIREVNDAKAEKVAEPAGKIEDKIQASAEKLISERAEKKAPKVKADGKKKSK